MVAVIVLKNSLCERGKKWTLRLVHSPLEYLGCKSLCMISILLTILSNMTKLTSSLIAFQDGEDSEVEGDDEAEEKITRNWSVLKSSPHLNKSKVINLHFVLIFWSCRVGCYNSYVDCFFLIMHDPNL